MTCFVISLFIRIQYNSLRCIITMALDAQEEDNNIMQIAERLVDNLNYVSAVEFAERVERELFVNAAMRAGIDRKQLQILTPKEVSAKKTIFTNYYKLLNNLLDKMDVASDEYWKSVDNGALRQQQRSRTSSVSTMKSPEEFLQDFAPTSEEEFNLLSTEVRHWKPRYITKASASSNAGTTVGINWVQNSK
eukprot:gb/GECG01010617.1/.p1 GENE.gb/GECG01010617.1/~~gb/GECG01010617.1/.p1  ORF type:complete len:191 (+),score=25.34 gb/GECG01010617.1/:1-573(+)